MVARRLPQLARLPLNNEQVARRLEGVAELLETQGENPFRVRAYRSAADTVRGLDRQAYELLQTEGREALTALPGIGDTLARSIEQLALTGRLPLLDQLHGETAPEELLATVPGVGPELAARVHERLGVRTLEDLERAAHDGRLAKVPGFGAKRLRAVRDALAGCLRRSVPRQEPAHEVPAVAELLDVDHEYRQKAEAGRLPRIAPKRFNPSGEAWLAVLRTRRGGHRYTALFSNTATAHRLQTTRDWVVIYRDDDGGRQQWTAVMAHSGPLKGRRVIRGRERECAHFYAEQAEVS